MGYAAVYKQRNAPWKKILRRVVFCLIIGVVFYCSLQLLDSQTGLMMGGAGGK